MKPQMKEEVTSPGKKPKVKLPDVEKTLINWARKQQGRGMPITTDELRKQVLMFTSGRIDQQTYTSTEWLESFQKRYLSGDSRSPYREDTVETSTSHSETLKNSPTSSNGLVSPPMSAVEKSERSEDVFDFGYEESPSLPHGFSSDAHTSSEAMMSPISPEISRDYMSSQFADELI